MNLDEQVELLYRTVADIVTIHAPDDVDNTMGLVRDYANSFAQFQMTRVESALHADASYSAARAVRAQVEKLDALKGEKTRV